MSALVARLIVTYFLNCEILGYAHRKVFKAESTFAVGRKFLAKDAKIALQPLPTDGQTGHVASLPANRWEF